MIEMDTFNRDLMDGARIEFDLSRESVKLALPGGARFDDKGA